MEYICQATRLEISVCMMQALRTILSEYFIISIHSSEGHYRRSSVQFALFDWLVLTKTLVQSLTFLFQLYQLQSSFDLSEVSLFNQLVLCPITEII